MNDFKYQLKLLELKMGNGTDAEIFNTMTGRHFKKTAEQIVLGACDILKNGNAVTYRFNPEISFADKKDPDGSHSVAYYDLFIAEKVPVAGIAIVKADGRVTSSVTGCVTRPNKGLSISCIDTTRQPHTDAALSLPFTDRLVSIASSIYPGNRDGALSEASANLAKCVKLLMSTPAPV